MKRWGLSAALLLLCTCVKTNEPSAGSQTHFLASCEAGCPDPYVCSCGVCTLACTDDRTCAAESPSATCSAGPSAESGCRVAPSVCDVECNASRDCASLGVGFSCRDGRCREPLASGSADASAGADDAAMSVDAGSAVDAAPEPDVAPSADVICDGSDDMRLGLTVGGGFEPPASAFANPFGISFLFVDGRCRYFVSFNYMHGIRSGSLTDAQANQLATAIGWSKLPAWSALPEDESCPDAGQITIRRPGAATSCSCGCDASAPADKVAAFAQITPQMQILAPLGEPLTGSVSAIASEADLPTVDDLPWPLARPMASIDGLVQPLGVFSDVGARFEDADEAAQLRTLRAQALDRNASIGFVPLSDSGATYQLYVRDELPDGVASAITALLE